jgi:hypothetical protein
VLAAPRALLASEVHSHGLLVRFPTISCDEHTPSNAIRVFVSNQSFLCLAESEVARPMSRTLYGAGVVC